MFGGCAAGAGSANTGGGGGGGTSTNPTSPRTATGGAGGSGHVIIREYANTLNEAPGVWNINEVYDNVKAGTWSNTN